MEIDLLRLLNMAIPVAVGVTGVALGLAALIFVTRLATPQRYRRFLARDVYIVMLLIALTIGLFIWRDAEWSQRSMYITALVPDTDRAGYYEIHLSAPFRCEGDFYLQTQDGTRTKATRCGDSTYPLMPFVFDPPLPAGTIITRLIKSKGARVVSETGVELKSYDILDFVVGESSR